MTLLVRTVIKTYTTGAWGQASVKLIEVEADDAKQAEAAAISLVDQQVNIDHCAICTAVFPKDCQLRPFCARVDYTVTDEFDDYETEGVGFSFLIQAPSIDEAKRIARAEAPLHLNQYQYFREVTVSPG